MDQVIVKKPNKALKIVKIVVDVLLYILVAVMLVFSITIIYGRSQGNIPGLFGKGYLSVASDSMEGTSVGSFSEGDLIIVSFVSETQKEKLAVGDVITFYDIDLKEYNTHRIYAEPADGLLVTKGDNSVGTDQRAISRSEVVAVYYSEALGISASKLTGFGNVLSFLRSPVGFGVVIFLPCLAILIYEGIKLARIIIQNNRQKSEEKLASERALQLAELEAEKEALRAQLEAEKEAERAKMREELRREMISEEKDKERK